MSATISSFGDHPRKRTPSRTGNYACSECGGQWFIAKVAVAKQRGTNEPGDVVGYAAPLRCVDCGTAQE